MEKQKVIKLINKFKFLLNEKKNKINPKHVKGRKQIRAEVNEIETSKTIEKINQTKSWVFKKINNIYKLCLARLTKGKREKAQIINIRNKIWDTITDPAVLKK